MALLASTEQRVLEEAIKVVTTETELPGTMPEEVRMALVKLPLDEQQRAAVRSTKKSIVKRLQSLKIEEPNNEMTRCSRCLSFHNDNTRCGQQAKERGV